MKTQRTLSIIKPDATARNLVGVICKRLEDAGLRIVAQRRVWLRKAEAQAFYAVHAARPFYGELVEMMTSGPIVVQVLEGPDAIALNREIMGATNPIEAAEGTIRQDYALSLGENSVHGSDSPENAEIEIRFFFRETEILS